MFSKACEYGIKAMIFIAQSGQDERRVSLKDIARQTDSPLAFTAKILQTLSRAGLLISTKGPTGGFVLARKPEAIYLVEIVEAIDGNDIFTGCGLGLEVCSAAKPCPVHFKFEIVRNELSKMLHTTTLQELAKGLKEGIAFLTH